jgi:hypothetical protein
MLRIALDATKPTRWGSARCCRPLLCCVTRCRAPRIGIPWASSFGTVPSHETNQTDAQQPLPLVYESPLGSVVTKLRTVSLATALIGTAGVPSLLAIKGAVPEVGMLAMALMFVTGSMGSTAAIHFVFAPYVYRIETIPVRQCSYQSKDGEDQNDTPVPDDAEAATVVPRAKDVLLRAWTRSLFLRNREIVFDPETDVVPYSGMRPLCNFVAKGFPLYVHPGTFWFGARKLYKGCRLLTLRTFFSTVSILLLIPRFSIQRGSPEYVHDLRLRTAMNLNVQNFVPQKSNPDDDLL